MSSYFVETATGKSINKGAMAAVKVDVLPLEQAATPDLSNVNKHTQRGRGLLENSLRKRGAFRSIASAGKGVKIPVVGAGNLTFQTAAEAGFTEVVNVHVTGNQIVNVVRDDIEPGSPEFYALAIEDNEIGKSSYNPDIDILAAIMADPAMQTLKAEDKILSGILDGVFPATDVSGVDDKEEKAKQKAKTDVDIIYTAGCIGKTAVDEPSVVLTHCCLAVRSGWMYGVQSEGSGGVCATVNHQERHKPQFIDNDYFHYNHKLHVEAVKKWKPKYCTVRDIMTEEQCQNAGIPFFTFSQIMDYANELQQYAENVIVIPKFDCIKDIPKNFMLGYSVPTSHGGTPLAFDRFKNRRVHLLGGSPKKQLAYYNAMPQEVVSLDNNYILKIANYGQAWFPEGTKSLTDLGFGLLNNPLYVSLAISLGNFSAMFNKIPDESAKVKDGLIGEID